MNFNVVDLCPNNTISFSIGFRLSLRSNEEVVGSWKNR